jgi:hypothetical protein
MTGGHNGRSTYDFIAAKFDEGVKKRANPCEAGGHSDILRISGGENFDVTLEGLDDGKYHFLKVRIQEIRLLLETLYLRHRRGHAAMIIKPIPTRARSLTVATPGNAVASTLIWSPHRMDPGSGRAKEGRRRFSRNHSRFSNFVRIARSAALVSSWTLITRRWLGRRGLRSGTTDGRSCGWAT